MTRPLDASDYETAAQYSARLRYNGQCGALYGQTATGAVALDGYTAHCTLTPDHNGAHQDREGSGDGTTYEWAV